MPPTQFMTARPTPWEKVKQALANPIYDFRTVEGICRETELRADEVQAQLDVHKDEVRIALATDNKDRVLYTLRSRPPKTEEVLFNVISVVASTSSAS